MKVILPLRAEFGMKVWWHAPAVHAIKTTDGKIVYIEPGDEALYPSAFQHIVIDRQSDELRRNRYDRDRDFVAAMRFDAKQRFGDDVDILEPSPDSPRKRFVPEPTVTLGLNYDVVVCPRRRMYGAEKNWPEWIHLVDWLQGAGVRTFAAGAPDSSYQVKCDKAWELPRKHGVILPRFLDATIEAMLGAKLVVATDAGLAHLAVLCGVPLLMLTYADGLVAPGPIVDETGKHFEDQYFKVKTERYEEANHRSSEVTILRDAWYDPATVFNTILRRVT